MCGDQQQYPLPTASVLYQFKDELNMVCSEKQCVSMARVELLLVLCVLADFVCSKASVYANCSPLEAADGRVSVYGLLRKLTQPCLYNVVVPPGPLNVSTAIYVYNSHPAGNLRYDLYLLLQLEYSDPRLAYYSIAPSVSEIAGGQDLQELIWTPHIYLVNNHGSEVMGALKKDIRVTVYPDGKVIFAQRLKTTLTCWMRLHKFPFDEQRCSLMIENWIYSNELWLEWKDVSPVSVPADMHMSEYYVSSMWTKRGKERQFHMARFHRYEQSSISTILTFITLSCQTGSATPTVSYIVASEVWFVACTAFIFGSLVEFAFVNIISRRRRHVELKKVTGKYILKSTLTPNLARKRIGGRTTSGQTAFCGPSGNGSTGSNSPTASSEAQVPFRVPDIPQRQDDEDEELGQTQDFTNEDSNIDNNSRIQPAANENNQGSSNFTTMTPQQIAKWIDLRSRISFPVLFLVFNIVYWGFIFLDMAQEKSTAET